MRKIAAAKKPCANRCGGVVEHAHLSKCNDCLLGLKRIEKMAAQQQKVETLPPLTVSAGAWGFRVPGLPVAWNNALIRMKGRRPFLSPRAREWKQSIAIVAATARPKGWPTTGSYDVEILSVFANPRADADGPVKLVLDALTLCAWRDDKQVAQVTARKLVDASAPRIEVVVRLAANPTEQPAFR